MTSGRYVAEKVCLGVSRGRNDEDERGDGVPDEDVVRSEGCENVI
jgi:hypothetical protein